MRYLQLIVTLFFSLQLFAQRPYGHEKAIPADSLIFIGWAVGGTVERGFQNCNDTALGLADVGELSDVMGQPGTNGVLSLGDGGSAILQFGGLVKNGPGPDFAIFENSIPFSNGDSIFYIEYAFVEVSNDGIHFVRFPSLYDGDTSLQKDFQHGNNPLKSKNLAGNFTNGYGTPFDLQDLMDSTNIDLNAIRYIKIIDAVGSLLDTFARFDQRGVKVNDPWPTPFPSSGFDLDAVGIIHGTTGIQTHRLDDNLFFPNPIHLHENLNIKLNSSYNISILNSAGNEMLKMDFPHMQPIISLDGLTPGIYMVRLSNNETICYSRLVIIP